MSKQLIAMHKSRKKPCVGDVFVLQPFSGTFYFGKVIQSDLQSDDSFIRGMFLVYIYDYSSTKKEIVTDFENSDFLIAPMIINTQPWLKGYFETIGNIPVTVQERNVEYGFWDVIKKHYVDIKGNVLDSPPKYHSIYGLGSYGIITKEVFKALGSDNALESES
ncbi:MAG: hypothetical protein E7559_09980 [Ruminococcaceae bacterium]|nr:hypothetical protein [Oscillospiraceae bacterium]